MKHAVACITLLALALGLGACGGKAQDSTLPVEDSSAIGTQEPASEAAVDAVEDASETGVSAEDYYSAENWDFAYDFEFCAGGEATEAVTLQAGDSYLGMELSEVTVYYPKHRENENTFAMVFATFTGPVTLRGTLEKGDEEGPFAGWYYFWPDEENGYTLPLPVANWNFTRLEGGSIEGVSTEDLTNLSGIVSVHYEGLAGIPGDDGGWETLYCEVTVTEYTTGLVEFGWWPSITISGLEILE